VVFVAQQLTAYEGLPHALGVDFDFVTEDEVPSSRISERRAVVEAAGNLARHANLMLRLQVESDAEKPEELYAKVVQLLDESSNRYVIHFTSIPPKMRAWLRRLAGLVNSP
jgi:hypothetical protein